MQSLQQALARQKQTGRRLGAVLQDLGFVTDDPPVVFRSTDTVLSSPLATMRSGLPSPLTSATATDAGPRDAPRATRSPFASYVYVEPSLDTPTW